MGSFFNFAACLGLCSFVCCVLGRKEGRMIFSEMVLSVVSSSLDDAEVKRWYSSERGSGQHDCALDVRPCALASS
jgi:hypothetical protein